MKDKSMINMAGTSMGSYDKPMMKGSGLEMKCGSQLGKYMGGPKMMGGDEKKKPMEKMPSAHQSKIDRYMGTADKISTSIKEKMDGTGSPDIDLRKAAYYTEAFYNKAKDLEKKGPYSGIDSRLGTYKSNPRTGEMILPDLGPVPKTLTKRGSRKSKK